ncbi:MAG: hypothetical protein K0S44_238 [Bacteroidetes bacterium]|jgi:hypothetical protein|nr:hypothetical protein [Bacteroidota bacterium]
MGKSVQIDVISGEDNGIYKCNLYAGGRCVRVFMHQHDYELLIHDGFFIRDGKSFDSAGVLNTSRTYVEQKTK